jgi:hypothetical protein
MDCDHALSRQAGARVVTGYIFLYLPNLATGTATLSARLRYAQLGSFQSPGRRFRTALLRTCCLEWITVSIDTMPPFPT